MRPFLFVDFVLRPGHILLINNRWILRKRTAFECHASLLQLLHHRPDLVERMLIGCSSSPLMARNFRLENADLVNQPFRP